MAGRWWPWQAYAYAAGPAVSLFPLMSIDVPMPAGTRTPGAQPPIFMADGRPVQFFVRDDDGQWFTAAPGGAWQECGPPSA